MIYQTAATILALLGGNKFRAMTGAYSLNIENRSMSGRLPTKSNKHRIGGFRIELNGADLYDLKVFRFKGSLAKANFGIEVFGEAANVDAENLAAAFSNLTGLAVSL